MVLNLKDYPRKQYNIDQFAQPPCYELEGETFYFVMDGGYDYELRITGRTSCQWNIAGEAPHEESYRCLKADDDTYLFHYDVKGANPRTGHTYVIDTEQRLVTMIICKVGLNPRFPYLVSTEFDFGALRIEGEELPFKRHSFTTDLLETQVQWNWRPGFFTQHYYYCTNFYRITYPKTSGAKVEFTDHSHLLPSSDEWARYIKIKGNIYLFVLTEELQERILQGRSRFRSNSMAFLQNYDRMNLVGRSFGNAMVEDKAVPINMLFSAFGQPVELPPEFLNAPNPYVV